MDIFVQALFFVLVIAMVYIVIGGFVYLFLYFFNIEALIEWVFGDEVNED